MEYKSDIEIAREASKLPIQEIGNKLDIPADHLLPFGHDKAKISTEFISEITYQNLNGEYINEDLTNKKTIIVFWADY